jgi:NADPH:quinone reductase-like Zn-dependent oxidoreductase
MRALTLVATGGIEHLKVQELPKPAIERPHEVLVRIHSVALNRLDLFVIDGLPGFRCPFPHVVGSDGAGVVEQVGPEVSRIRPGDRVMINPVLSCGHCAACMADEQSLCEQLRVVGEHLGGTAADYIVLPSANLALIPDTMPWAEAASFSLATLTAWRMLVTRARLKAGEWVLIWGIGGGVALAALQITRLLGGKALVTSGADSKLDLAQRLGAEGTINHKRSDVVAEVRRLTAGAGADVVVDNVGERSWGDSLRCLRRGGRLVICGATTGPHVSLDLRRLFWRQWDLLGSTLGNNREYSEIVRLAGEGKLWPVIDRVVPWDEAMAAFARLQTGEQTGKLVIEVAP